MGNDSTEARCQTLEKELERQKKISAVLMDRVERSMDLQGGAFSLFQAATVLEEKVRERTAKLAQTLEKLEQSNRDLLLAKEMADAANTAKSDFLANMSHELRTPLNHIIGFTELVVDGNFGELNGQQKEYLQDVLESSRHLLSLINDVLDLSKVESGKLEIQTSRIHLEGFLRHSLTMIKEKALSHGIHLAFELVEIPEFVQADERKLKQVLYNLLSNAAKFTPDGGQVVLSARGLNGNEGSNEGWHAVEISVRDTGIGIDSKDLERIFDPFEQVENSKSRKFQGTGLGLSLTKRLVELHGGRIWAESEGAGKGSIFRLRIPAII
jgi:signal transduction histidine kinase